jgi:hypothetical protein
VKFIVKMKYVIRMVFLLLIFGSCQNELPKIKKNETLFLYVKTNNGIIKIDKTYLSNIERPLDPWRTEFPFIAYNRLFYNGPKNDTISFSHPVLQNKNEVKNENNSKEQIEFTVESTNRIEIKPIEIKSVMNKIIKADSDYLDLLKILPKNEIYICSHLKIATLTNKDKNSFTLHSLGRLKINKQIKTIIGKWSNIEINGSDNECMLDIYYLNPNDIALTYIYCFEGDTNVISRYKLITNTGQIFYSNEFEDKVYKSQINFMNAYFKHINR